MATLAELKVPSLNPIIDQLRQLNVVAPTLDLPLVTDEFTINLDTLTAMAKEFNDLLRTLPTKPEALLQDLLGDLKQVAGGSLEVSGLINQIVTPFTQADSVLGEFSDLKLLTNLLLALARLREQPVDQAMLIQFLPISGVASRLTSQLPAVLEPHLAPVQQVRSQINSLLQLELDSGVPLLGGYQTLLEEIATLPLNPGLTVKQLPSLDDTWIKDFTGQIDRFNQGVTDIDLSSIQTRLNSLPDQLNTSLEQALRQLSPLHLAQESNWLNADLTALKKLETLDFSRAARKIQSVVQPLQTLADSGIATITNGAENVITVVEKAIGAADQAVVKVSALVTSVIDRVVDFIDSLDFAKVLDEAQDSFQPVIQKVNSVLKQVGRAIEQLYDFVRQMISKAVALGQQLPSIVDKFHQLLYQITTYLSDPRIKNAVHQVKQGIHLVLEKLDDLSLKPVFDQILTEAKRVKTSLKAIDLQRLNQMLKAALSAALKLIRNAIDPPTSVTEIVNDKYKTDISELIFRKVIHPVKQEIDRVVHLIHQLNPGTLLAQDLKPLHQQIVDSATAFSHPNQINKLLQPVKELQTSLRQQLDAAVNPQQLLKPLCQKYDAIVAFVQALDPASLLTPLKALLAQALEPLNKLDLEPLIETISTEIASITAWIEQFQIDEGWFETGIESTISTWIQRLKTMVQAMDLSVLQDLLSPLRSASTTLIGQLQFEGAGRLPLVEYLHQMVQQVSQYTSRYNQQMSDLAHTWIQAWDNLQNFQPPEDLKTTYQTLQSHLQRINPLEKLASTTWALDQLQKTAEAMLTSLTTIWKGLGDRLKKGRNFLDYLLSNQAAGLQLYLMQTIDALVDRSLKPAIRHVSQSLPLFREVMPLMRTVQESLKKLTSLPELIANLGQKIISLKETLGSFNLNFLIPPLRRAKETILPELKTFDPRPRLVVPLTEVYQKILLMLQKLDPLQLFTTAQGTLTLSGPATTTSLLLPAGTELCATTPAGDSIWFTTLKNETLPAGGEIEVPIRAMVAHRSSDLVEVEGVTWRFAKSESDLQDQLQAKHHQPILSLTTLVREQLLGWLTVLDPMTLIAKPLNEQYEQLLELFDELGIATLLDGLFQKIESLDQEIQTGLDQLGGAFVGLIAAIPL
jgi:hypothetical protein